MSGHQTGRNNARGTKWIHKYVESDTHRQDQWSRKDWEEHVKMYVPKLVKTEPGATGWASIMIALPDSRNLLAHAAIDAEFHKQLGIPIEDTKIRARAANKQAFENISKIPKCGQDILHETIGGQESIL